jgi:hypothetical protein
VRKAYKRTEPWPTDRPRLGGRLEPLRVSESEYVRRCEASASFGSLALPFTSQPVLLQPPVECTPAKTEGLSGSAGITAVPVERFFDE